MFEVKYIHRNFFTLERLKTRPDLTAQSLRPTYICRTLRICLKWISATLTGSGLLKCGPNPVRKRNLGPVGGGEGGILRIQEELGALPVIMSNGAPVHFLRLVLTTS